MNFLQEIIQSFISSQEEWVPHQFAGFKTVFMWPYINLNKWGQMDQLLL